MSTPADLPPKLSPKWLKQPPADTPVVAVVRRALRARYRQLRALQRGVLVHWQEHPEWVHQLRVATRRVAAAHSAFRRVLPRRRRRWLNERLRELRHAANDARNMDVLLSMLTSPLPHAPENDLAATTLSLDELMAEIQALRAESQHPLEATIQQLAAQQFDRKCRRGLAKVRWRESDSAESFDWNRFAQHAGRRALEKFQQVLAVPLSDVADKHRLRIATKKLRYSWELVADTFPESLSRSLWRELTELQSLLGAINDQVSHLQLVERMLDQRLGEASLWLPWQAFHRSELQRTEEAWNDYCAGDKLVQLSQLLEQLVVATK